MLPSPVAIVVAKAPYKSGQDEQTLAPKWKQTAPIINHRYLKTRKPRLLLKKTKIKEKKKLSVNVIRKAHAHAHCTD